MFFVINIYSKNWNHNIFFSPNYLFYIDLCSSDIKCDIRCLSWADKISYMCSSEIRCVFVNCDIFPLILLSDIVSINKLTVILKNIGKCDVKHIMTLPIKRITSVLKVLTYIITNIKAHPVGLSVIIVIMSVSNLCYFIHITCSYEIRCDITCLTWADEISRMCLYEIRCDIVHVFIWDQMWYCTCVHLRSDVILHLFIWELIMWYHVLIRDKM